MLYSSIPLLRGSHGSGTSGRIKNRLEQVEIHISFPTAGDSNAAGGDASSPILQEQGHVVHTVVNDTIVSEAATLRISDLPRTVAEAISTTRMDFLRSCPTSQLAVIIQGLRPSTTRQYQFCWNNFQHFSSAR